MATRKKATKKTTATKKSGSGNQGGGLVKIGALWLKEGKNGRFMSGVIKNGENENDVRILVFRNSFKEEPRHPDYVIYVPADEPGNRATSRPIDDDDIPF